MALLLALIFVVVVLLQLAPVQQFMAERVTSYLSGKLQTNVSVGRFTTDWSNSIVLKEFYLEDQQQDTLLYAGKLGLDVNLLALLRNRLILKSARIDDGVLNISYTLPDTASNFGFIRKAFNGRAGQPGDTATGFVVRLGKVNLKNVKLKLADAARGNYVNANIGRFTVSMQQFESEKAVYKIKKAALADSYISLLKTKLPVERSGPLSADVGFKNIALRNVFFKYRNSKTASQLSMQIGQSRIDADKTEVKNKDIRLNSFSLSKSSVRYVQGKPEQTDTMLITTKEGKSVREILGDLKNWKIGLKKLELKDVNLVAGTNTKPLQKAKPDFRNVNLSGLSLKLKNLVLEKQQLKTDLRQLKFKEKSGFQVVNAKAAIQADSTGFVLRKLDLATGTSRLQTTVSVKFPESQDRQNLKAKPTFTADIRKATVSPEDIAYFASELAARPVFQKVKKQPFILKGIITGQPDNLQAQNVTLQGFDDTRIGFSGKIKNLTAKTDKEFNVNLKNFTTTRQDLKNMLPAGTLPETLTLPETITITGGIASMPGNLVLNNLHIKASDGSSVLIKGFIHGQTGADKRLGLEIKKLLTNRKALEKMLPKGALAPEIKLPESIRFTGKLKGPSLNHFNSSGAFETTYGNFQTVFNLQAGQQFSGSLSVKDFNIGKLLSLDPDLSTATGKANFNGSGFKVNTMVLHFDAFIKKLTYKKEHFRNVELSGTLDKSAYAVDGNIRNIVVQGLGHKLKKVKKLKPKNVGVRKIFGKKKD